MYICPSVQDFNQEKSFEYIWMWPRNCWTKLEFKNFSLDLKCNAKQEIDFLKKCVCLTLTYIIRIVILCRFSESVDANEAQWSTGFYAPWRCEWLEK